MDTHIVILAAGKGTRMKSARPKVLHRVAGLAMIDHVIATAAVLQPRSTTVVIGHQAASLEAALAGHQGLSFVVQEPQLGTAHALLTTEPVLRDATGTLVLLSGDVPLLSAQTLKCSGTGTIPRARRPPLSRLSSTPPMGTAESSAPASRLHESSKSGTPPLPSGKSAKSTPAFTHLHSTDSSMPSGASRHRTRRMSITCRISWPSTRSVAFAWKQ